MWRALVRARRRAADASEVWGDGAGERLRSGWAFPSAIAVREVGGCGRVVEKGRGLGLSGSGGC